MAGRNFFACVTSQLRNAEALKEAQEEEAIEKRDKKEVVGAET